MSGVVLVLGALLAVAGVYEMVAGNGDILSERGWSAFIAGAVFVAGGVATIGLGLAVRAVDRLRTALARPALFGIPASEHGLTRVEPAPPPQSVASPSEPAAGFHDVSSSTVAEPIVAIPAAAALMPLATAGDTLGSRSPETSHAYEHAPGAAAIETPIAQPAPGKDDWLDRSFADLEREMAVEAESPPTQPATVAHDLVDHAPPHSEPRHAEPPEIEPAHAEPVHAEILRSETDRSDRYKPQQASTLLEERPNAEPEIAVAEQRHEIPAARPASDDHATIAAREEPAPSTSAVIGRYESEGTSYVMYADGAIDAQSEAGVYRFASMAELKAFIEG